MIEHFNIFTTINMLHEDNIIFKLFCSVQAKLKDNDFKHSQGKLWLSEIITIGTLFALKGGSFRQFYTWLERRNLFTLPTRSRLSQLLITHSERCNEFLSDPTILNVMDSLGIEVIHPIRENRSLQSQVVSSKGKSNHRWIVGRKLNIAINGNLEIIGYADEKDNECDNIFDDQFSKIEGIMLTDNNYRRSEKNGGTPENIKICPRGEWNDRMIIETLNSLWVRICKIKKCFHRTVEGFKARMRYLVALTNIILNLNEGLGFKRLSMVQWAL